MHTHILLTEISIYVISCMISCGTAPCRQGEPECIRFCSRLSISPLSASGCLFVPVSSYILAAAAFIIIGFGCAPIYPCIIHSTPNNFGAENSGAIIGIQMASAYVGSTFIPPVFGLLGNSISFKIMPIYLIFFFVLMITMIELTFRITGKNKVK